MSELKCPFCNGELVGTIGHPICRNQDCVMYDDPMPQDLLEELIRTRKALDVAVGALKDNLSQANFREMLDASRFHCIRTKCELALEQITALEQKDE